MKILIISHGYPQTNAPLNGIFEFDQAKALKAYGHEVIFASIDLRSIRRKRRFGKHWTKKEEIPIIDYSIPLGRFPDLILTFVGKLAIKSVYKDVVKRYGKPDILHAHFTMMGNIASVIRNKFNIPLIITEHNSAINEKNIPASFVRFAQNTYSQADRLIAVSSQLAYKIKSIWNFNSKVIHNIVDISIFNCENKNISDNFIFLSVGNLVHRKGFDLLINAFAHANFDDHVSLKIIGDGNLKENLQQQIDSLGLSSQVQLLGRMERDEIAESMNDCDAFVLASRAETFGVVYIEAMSAGLPVIATTCGGPEEFVTEGNGILIPTENEEKLTEALIKMRQTARKYDRQAISEETRKKFAPQTIASQITEVYVDILNSKKIERKFNEKLNK